MGRASILASIPCFVTDELWLTTTSDSLVNSLLTPRNISICIIMVAWCVIWQVLQSPYATSVAKYRNHKPKDFQSCIASWQLDLATPPISRQKSNENTVFHGHCLIASVRETLDLSSRSPTKNWKSHLTRHAIKAQQQAWPFHVVRQRWVAQGSLWQRWVFNRALLKDYSTISDRRACALLLGAEADGTGPSAVRSECRLLTVLGSERPQLVLHGKWEIFSVFVDLSTGWNILPRQVLF